MGKPELFDIVILQPQKFYLPGSWIEGVVVLRTQHVLVARSLHLKFVCKEKVAWSMKEIKTNENNEFEEKIQKYSKGHEHVDASIALWGYVKPTDGMSLPLTAGSYVFPFCVQVPAVDSLVPSCDLTDRMQPPGTLSFKANVMYSLVAHIDIPSGSDFKVSRRLCVLPRIPLPSDPAHNLSVEQEAVKELGCLCCKGGTIHVRARCLRPSVMVGEPVFFTAEILNKSETDVTGIEISLVTSGSFFADGHVRSGQRAEVTTEIPINVKQGENFSNLDCNPSSDSTGDKSGDVAHFYRSHPFALMLPSTLPPPFSGKAISLRYELIFRVRLASSFSFDIRVAFHPKICTQKVDVPVNTIGGPTILNPSGQPRTAALLQGANKGDSPVCFSFDGMNYHPNEQFEPHKAVTYPAFYDPLWNGVPSSLGTTNPALMQALMVPGIFQQHKEKHKDKKHGGKHDPHHAQLHIGGLHVDVHSKHPGQMHVELHGHHSGQMHIEDHGHHPGQMHIEAHGQHPGEMHIEAHGHHSEVHVEPLGHHGDLHMEVHEQHHGELHTEVHEQHHGELHMEVHEEHHD